MSVRTQFVAGDDGEYDMKMGSSKITTSLRIAGGVLFFLFALPSAFERINPMWFRCAVPIGGGSLICFVSLLVGLSFLIPALSEGRLKRFLIGTFVIAFPLGYFALVMVGEQVGDNCRNISVVSYLDPVLISFYLWLGSGVSVALHLLMRRGKPER